MKTKNAHFNKVLLVASVAIFLLTCVIGIRKVFYPNPHQNDGVILNLNNANASHRSRSDLLQMKRGEILKMWNARINQLSKYSAPIDIPVGIDQANYMPPELLLNQNTISPAIFVPGEQEKVDAELCQLAYAVVVLGGSSWICELLAEHDGYPSTKMQILLYNAAYYSFEEFYKQTAKASFTPWAEFAKAKSPIFRLLALNASDYVSTNGVHSQESPSVEDVEYDMKIKFTLFENLANDSNREIEKAALHKVSECAKTLPQASDLLKSKATSSDVEIAKLAQSLLLDDLK